MTLDRIKNKHIGAHTKNKDCAAEILNDTNDSSGLRCSKSQARRARSGWLTHRTFENRQRGGQA